MRMEREDLVDLGSALGRCWLETDGAGGYAASTAALCPTSRYHGLLVAPAGDTGRRHVLLSRFEETLRGGGREFALSTARWPGSTHPDGYRWIESFDAEPWPTWTYRIGHVCATREVLMVEGGPIVLCRWRVSGQEMPLELTLRPVLPCRDAAWLTVENPALDPRTTRIARGIVVRPYGSLPPVTLTISSRRAAWTDDPAWHRRIEYEEDLRNGYPGHEDQFTPGAFTVGVDPGTEVVVAATTAAPIVDPARLWREESARRRAAHESARGGGIRAALLRAAGQFVSRGPSGAPAIVAGFPWFGAWGRDTLVALLGLAPHRRDDVGNLLAGLRPFLRNGRLPTLFGPTPERSEYGSVDAALWTARAVRAWEVAGGERERLDGELLPMLVEIAEGHRDARGDDLVCDDDGVLVAPDPRRAPTWMDAVIAGAPVTPRNGAAVEVNALWWFHLAYLSRLLRRRGDAAAARRWDSRRNRMGRAFLARFWMPEEGCLADRWVDGAPDRSIRPNMVLAAALEFSPLSRAQRAGVVVRARDELITARGLRTLSPRGPRYRGRYEGDVGARDAAYHQGTVWPWLVGSYVEATLRARGRTAAARDHLVPLVEGFAGALRERCFGQVSEVYDGDPPQRPRGAFAQAWSVTELLRACDLLGLGTA